jgi:hypothetical protein
VVLTHRITSRASLNRAFREQHGFGLDDYDHIRVVSRDGSDDRAEMGLLTVHDGLL